jgi:hypothetical protein
MLPLRAFADEEAFRRFVEIARRYRDEAREAGRERIPTRHETAGVPDTNNAPNGGATSKPGAPKEVNYELTVEDHIAFNRYHHAFRWPRRLNWGWHWLLYWRWWLLPGILIVLAVQFWSSPRAPQPEPAPPPQSSAWDTVNMLFVTAIVVFNLLLWVSVAVFYLGTAKAKRIAWQVGQQLNDPDTRKRMLGWRRTSLGPKGLSSRGDAIDSTVGWTAILKIAATKEHAFFYESATQAIVVPRRAFANDAEFREFVATARGYHDAARHEPREGRTHARDTADEGHTDVAPDEDAAAPGNAVMEAEFVQTLEDHFAFARHRVRSLPWWRRSLPMTLVGVLAPLASGYFIYLMFSELLQQSLWDQVIWMAMLTSPVSIWVVMVVWGMQFTLELHVRRLVNHPDNRKRMLGWRRCAIGPAGVTFCETEAANTVAWSSILRIAHTDEHAFLYTTNINAIVVPRLAFAGDADFRAFVATARAFLDKAQRTPRGGESSRGKAVDEPETNITPDQR